MARGKRKGVAHSGGLTLGQHNFSMIPSANIERSVFNRSHGLKTAFDSGFLIPIYCDEALPGDSFKMRCNSFVRMTTPIFPVMDNIYLDFFFFAVPIRLIWDNWHKFNGEQKNPGDSTVFLTPIISDIATEGSLSDYLGIPLTITTHSFCSFWHRAYNLIFNEWFRDENLTNSAVVDTDDGPDTLSDYVLRRRAKRHDYFTSCLPFPQKGTAVSLPLGTTAPVIGTGADLKVIGAASGVLTALQFETGAPQHIDVETNTSWADSENLRIPTAAQGVSGMVANLASATAATINDIRQAFQIQRLLERDARGGSRYTEIIRSHFGVVSPDARLQRPEYLGGGSVRVNVHPVAATTFVSGPPNLQLGELAGFATAAGGVGFFKSFTEHCVLLGLCNVRADLLYQQGKERMFSRRTRFDFYWPALAHLGEQAVLNQEIFCDGSANDVLTFGYQERYAEYRYKPSRTSGVMRSTHSTPIDQWHLGIEFASLPLLNNVFIEDNAPFNRVLAVTTEPQFFGDFYFDLRCARPMPTFSVPGLIDHF